jgi:hypothetical protein
VTQDVIDPELLGMFLDGSATADERTQVMELAATSPRAMRELREAVAIHGELTGEPVTWPEVESAVRRIPAPAAMPPAGSRTGAHRADTRSGWRHPRTLALGLLAAAALAVVVAASLRRGTSDTIEIGQVARIEDAAGPGTMTRLLGTSWNSAVTVVVRGSERSSMHAAERAFAAGVWTARFEVASVARDTTAAVQIVDQLRVVLREVAGVAPVLARLQDAARDVKGSSQAARVTVVQQLRVMSRDERCFDVGLWRGAVDLAVLRTGGDATGARTRLAANAAGCLGVHGDTE